jgi:hypothetical protein
MEIAMPLRQSARWSFQQAWRYAEKRAMETRSQYFVCRVQDGEYVDFYAVAAVCADKDDLSSVVGTLPSLACFNPK